MLISKTVPSKVRLPGVVRMSLCSSIRSVVTRLLAVVAFAASMVSLANAQAYSFNQFLSGGGGGQDPKNKVLATSMGGYICLGVSPDVQPNSVRFLLVSKIPQPRSRITSVVFDVGRHAGLFRNVAVMMASPGAKGQVVPAQHHPFLRGLTPDFAIHVPQQGHMKPDGLSPGRMMAISATLGPGTTITDVRNALDEGLNPATAATGLRVGVIVLYLLGGPPPGVGTIQDDGGFATTAPSPACR